MNNKLISLIINAGVAIIAIIGIYLVIVAMGNTAVIDPVTGQESADTSSVSSAVNFAMFVLYLGLGVIAIFTVVAIAFNPQRFIRTGVGIVIFGLLMVVAYFMVGELTLTQTMLDMDTVPTTNELFWGDLGIKATYVLVVVAVGLIIAQSVRSLLSYFAK